MRRRVRIGKGLYRDQWGLSAVVNVRGKQRERRFPFDTPEPEMQAWQAAAAASLWDDYNRNPSPPRDASSRGTLARDIVRYLRMIAGRPSYASERAHLRAWLTRHPKTRRAQLRAEDVALAIAAWTSAGVAAQTVIHRCRVLRQLYHALDGATARTPVDHVKRPAKPKSIPVTVPTATIVKVLKALERRDPLAAARFRVLATTGQRPTQVMQAEPKDVNLKRSIWLVRPAKGSETRELYLNADMKAAWKAFIKANAWGQYETTAYARLLRKCGWPKGIRPYNVRHSFAVAALEQGIDLGDVQGMLGHTEIETTRTFYAPILQTRLKAASARMDGRFPKR